MRVTVFFPSLPLTTHVTEMKHFMKKRTSLANKNSSAVSNVVDFSIFPMLSSNFFGATRPVGHSDSLHSWCATMENPLSKILQSPMILILPFGKVISKDGI